MSLKVEEAQLRKKAATQKSQKRRARGIMFLEAAVILPMAAVITFGGAYYLNAYVTKMRLGDSARVIARAIQDDPGITQGGLTGTLGDLDRVVLAATGIGTDAIPAAFNVETYKSCNPDLSAMSDDVAREHFVRAGRYENRAGVFGDCGQQSDLGSKDTVVSIRSYKTQPTNQQIKSQFPYYDLSPDNKKKKPTGWHPSGRKLRGSTYGWSYANPNKDKTQPYWISVVTKKPAWRLALFGWTFGKQPEIVNYAVVRVGHTGPPPCEGAGKVLRVNSSGQFVCDSLKRSQCYWHPLPKNTRDIWCPYGYFVISLHYEGATWTNRIDNHIGPEIHSVHCCKIE